MDKKELKWYVTPAPEIIELELEGHLLDASLPDAGNEEDDEKL